MRCYAAIACLAPGIAVAQAETGGAPLEPFASPYLLKLTGGLILVVAAIFAFAWLIKKLNLNQQSPHGLIRIVAGLPLGTRDRIVLVQIGDEQILLGLTPGRIEKLHTLAEPLDAPGGAPPAGSPANASFARRLKDAMRERPSS